jgi:glyoxylase I family protein
MERDATASRVSGFHHIAMKTADFDATLAFYVGGLGFRDAYSWGEDARASGGGDSRAVMLDTGDGNYIEVFAGGAGTPDGEPPAGTILHAAYRTRDCDAMVARALEAGAELQMPPPEIQMSGEPSFGIRIAFVRGPSGETIEFFQNEVL